jgi:hypothetical protein
MRWFKFRSSKEKDAEVIVFLAANPDSFGLEICKACNLGRGTIYLRLGRLEDEGWITSVYEPQRHYSGIELLRRRLYRVEPSRRLPIEEKEAEVVPLFPLVQARRPACSR